MKTLATIKKIKNKPEALYIHIPFCDHLCYYCDFTKLFYNEKFATSYLDALFLELDSYKIDKVKTIYLGGGTPTALSDELFLKLLNKVKNYLDVDAEFSVESNVESLSKTKLKMMKDAGVTRLSIGVESCNDITLKMLGRMHTFSDVKNAVSLAKTFNFDSLNVDLIYGVPKQSLDDLKSDLENILDLDVDHVSIYSLTIKPGTKFYLDKIKEQNEDDSRDYYDLILKTMRDHHYKRYEVSNFARNKKFSKHNMIYWKDEHYYGIGLGASGYIDNIRYQNTKSLKNYLKGDYIDNLEEVTLEDDLTYYLMLNFRLEDGFLLDDFKKHFGFDFHERFDNKIKKHRISSLFNEFNGRITLTDEGIMILDRVILDLI